MNMPVRLKKSQFAWNVARKLAFLYPEKSFHRVPDRIIFEPTNMCNLKCPPCPTNLEMRRPRGMLDFELFKSFINEFKGMDRKPKIKFNFAGEPLINPHIADIVRFAADHGHKTMISTNATLLTEDLSRRLLDAGLDTVLLCLDGLTKEAHEAYRVGSDFEQVKANIETFLRLRRSLKGASTFSVIQTLLTAESENQRDDMVQWALEAGADSLSLKTLNMSFHSNETADRLQFLLPKNRALHRKTSVFRKTLCRSVMTEGVIFYNGDMGICCMDYNNETRGPNICKLGYLETFQSPEAVRQRKDAFRMKLEICSHCGMSNSDVFSFKYDLNAMRGKQG